MKIKSFKDLVVWQLLSKLSKEMSELVKNFPASEKFALSDDLLRSARSIPCNISEGFGRYHFSEKIQFYNTAKGSTLEAQNHLIEAFNNKYISEEEKARFLNEYHIVEVSTDIIVIPKIPPDPPCIGGRSINIHIPLNNYSSIIPWTIYAFILIVVVAVAILKRQKKPRNPWSLRST